LKKKTPFSFSLSHSCSSLSISLSLSLSLSRCFSLVLLLSDADSISLPSPSQNSRKTISSEKNQSWIFFGARRFCHCKWFCRLKVLLCCLIACWWLSFLRFSCILIKWFLQTDFNWLRNLLIGTVSKAWLRN
jgi:hypothetical protein